MLFSLPTVARTIIIGFKPTVQIISRIAVIILLPGSSIVFHIMQGTHDIDQTLPPELCKPFATNHQCIIHRLVKSQTVHAHKIFQRLVNIGKVL